MLWLAPAGLRGAIKLEAYRQSRQQPSFSLLPFVFWDFGSLYLKALRRPRCCLPRQLQPSPPRRLRHWWCDISWACSRWTHTEFSGCGASETRRNQTSTSGSLCENRGDPQVWIPGKVRGPRLEHQLPARGRKTDKYWRATDPRTSTIESCVLASEWPRGSHSSSPVGGMSGRTP